MRKRIFITVLVVATLVLAALASLWTIRHHSYSKVTAAANAIEAKVKRHRPHHATIEKFLEALPDDGSTWAVVTSVAAKVDAILGGEIVSGTPELAGAAGRFRESTIGTSAVLHDPDIGGYRGLVTLLDPALAPLLSISFPRTVCMVPPPEARTRDEISGVGGPEAILLQKVLHRVTAAKFRMGQREEAERLLVWHTELLCSLIPCSLIDCMIATMQRSALADELLLLSEAGMLSEGIKARLREIILRSPVVLEHVALGEILSTFHGDFPDGTPQSFGERIGKLLHDPEHLSVSLWLAPEEGTLEAMESQSFLADTLDPSFRPGRLLGRLPLAMSVADLAAQAGPDQSTPELLENLLLSTVVEAGHFQVLVNLALDAGHSSPAPPPVHSPTAPSTETHQNLESLAHAALGASCHSGTSVRLGGKVHDIPWKIAFVAAENPVKRFSGNRFGHELAVAVPSVLLKHGPVELVSSQTDGGSITVRFLNWRAWGSEASQAVPEAGLAADRAPQDSAPNGGSEGNAEGVADEAQDGPINLASIPDSTLVLAWLEGTTGDRHIVALSFPRSITQSRPAE